MKNSTLFILLFFSAIYVNAQNVKFEIKTKDSNSTVLIKELRSDDGGLENKVYIVNRGVEEFVGIIPGKIDEVTSAFLGIKYSGRQNFRLSLIVNTFGFGLRFFSADRFLDQPNVYFPYALKEGKWMVTTVNFSGALLQHNPSDQKHQVDSVHWYNAKIFKINYKKDKRGNDPIESQTFAEIDGELEWLGLCAKGFSTEKNNLIEK